MSIVMGQELAAMRAANFVRIQPTLVTIHGGTFMMGAADLRGANPVHQATVSTFQMGRTPVTNNEYARFVDSLGNNRYALITPNPVTRMELVFALG